MSSERGFPWTAAVGAVVVFGLPFATDNPIARIILAVLLCGTSMALLVSWSRRDRQHAIGNIASIADTRLGDETTIRGRVTSDAQVRSPTSGEAFVMVVCQLLETDGLGLVVAKHIGELRKGELWIDDGTGTASVQAENIRHFGDRHRSVRWASDKHAPEVKLVDLLRKHAVEPERVATEESSASSFEYVETVLRSGDTATITGRVRDVGVSTSETGYRDQDAVPHIVMGDGAEGALLLRSLSDARYAAEVRHTRRELAVALAMIGWAVALFFVPVLI